MSNPISLIAAQDELCNGRHDADAWLCYRKDHNLCSETLRRFIRAYVIRNIIECGNNRFEFTDGHQNQIPALVFPAFGPDGETVIDIAALPLFRPDQPRPWPNVNGIIPNLLN